MKKHLVTRAHFSRLAGVSPAAVTKACASVLLPAVDGKRVDAAHPSAVKYLEEKTQPIEDPPAIGIDVEYDRAVRFCEAQGYASYSSVQRHFKMGYERAKRIVKTMRAAGVEVATRTHLNVKTAASAVIAQPSVPKEKKDPHVRGPVAAKQKKKAEVPVEEDGMIHVPENIQAFLDFTLIELIEQFGTDVRFIDWLNATQKIEGINEKRLKNAATEGKLISRNLVETGVIDIFNSAHLRLLKDGAKSIAAGVISKHAGGSELAEIELFITDILGSFIKPVKSKIVRVLKDV